MRFVKTSGLVAIAILAAMAFGGPSSASATNTQLCKTHTSLTCASGVTSASLVPYPGTTWKLLNSIVDVLCLNASTTLEPQSLGSPQTINEKNLSLTNCGTTSAHNNCTITVESLRTLTLLKVALNEGVLTTTGGLIHVKCTVLGFPKIDCKYSLADMQAFVDGGNPAFVFESAPVDVYEGDLCPDENYLEATFVTTSGAYVLG